MTHTALQREYILLHWCKVEWCKIIVYILMWILNEYYHYTVIITIHCQRFDSRDCALAYWNVDTFYTCSLWFHQFKQTQNKQIQYLDECFNFTNLANFVIITTMRTIIKPYLDNSYGDLRFFNTNLSLLQYTQGSQSTLFTVAIILSHKCVS